jgi:alkanesulfonate monooxygenase SsuD/methylene tetrahydromethanopterin reductase-like flavin-dependent oxidoreductase (luciferase family)
VAALGSVQGARVLPLTRLRFGIITSQQNSAFDDILACWQEAEQLGFDTAWMFDHFVPLLGPRDGPCGDGWTLLPVALSKTERIRGGLMVTANHYRHPAVLANMAATTDVLSGGRLEFGIGAGAPSGEHEMYGIAMASPAERVRRLGEACQVLKALWTQHQATFNGTYYQLREAYCEPKPVQRPYPHFVIGALGEALTLRVAAEHADEWNVSSSTTPEVYAHKAEAMSRHLEALRRDPASLQRSILLRPTGTVAEQATRALEFVRLGVDHLIFMLAEPYRTADVRRVWQELVPAVRNTAGR